MADYAAQFRDNGRLVSLTVSGDGMEDALQNLKRDNPQGSGFSIWNPDHVPPRAGKLEG